jgi:hypothetical protein
MDEHEFLQVLGGISLLHKNVRQELEGCLKLRNSAGHPTPLQIGPNKVAAHVETLLLNVFVPFT